MAKNDRAEAKVLFKMTQGQLDDTRKEAYNEGVGVGLKKAIDWVTDMYVWADERPDRGTPEALALLKMAKELSEYLKTEREKL